MRIPVYTPRPSPCLSHAVLSRARGIANPASFPIRDGSMLLFKNLRRRRCAHATRRPNHLILLSCT